MATALLLGLLAAAGWSAASATPSLDEFRSWQSKQQASSSVSADSFPHPADWLDLLTPDMRLAMDPAAPQPAHGASTTRHSVLRGAANRKMLQLGDGGFSSAAPPGDLQDPSGLQCGAIFPPAGCATGNCGDSICTLAPEQATTREDCACAVNCADVVLLYSCLDAFRGCSATCGGGAGGSPWGGSGSCRPECSPTVGGGAFSYCTCSSVEYLQCMFTVHAAATAVYLDTCLALPPRGDAPAPPSDAAQPAWPQYPTGPDSPAYDNPSPDSPVYGRPAPDSPTYDSPAPPPSPSTSYQPPAPAGEGPEPAPAHTGQGQPPANSQPPSYPPSYPPTYAA